MTKIIDLLRKYRELLAYGIIGVSTTLLNFLLYYVMTRVLNIDYMVANVMAYLIALIYAFFTNKYIVFVSKSVSKAVIFHETISFFGMRLIAGILDSFLMYIGVDVLTINDSLTKIVVTLLIIIINYFVSKYMVFTKNKECSEETGGRK